MSPTRHGPVLAALLLAGAALPVVPAQAQGLQQPIQQQQLQQQQIRQQQLQAQGQTPAADSQVRLQVQLPPQEAPDAAQCPDAGSFVAIGPTARRGEPITAQSWNDCADLPRRGGAQQPLIGVEIPLPIQQGRPRR